MRITLILSTSETGLIDRLRPEVERMREAGHEIRVRLPFDATDASDFAREATRVGSERIIAAGGDGTVHHIVDGLNAAMEAGGTAPSLAIVPLGTGNDFAGGLGIPEDWDEAMRVALDGVPMPVDIGRINEDCFINASVGGITAEATEETSEEAKELLGAFAYALTGVRKLADLSPSRGRFHASGRELYAGPFLFFAVGNGRRTGAGNFLTPEADPSDGQLDLCLVRDISRLEFLALLPKLRAGTHLDDPAVLYTKVRELEVEPETPIALSTDGEPQQGSAYRFRVSPHQVRVVVPRTDEPL